MKERKKGRRFLALLLAFVMVFSLIPTTVYAGNEDGNQVHLIVENKRYSMEDGAPWDGELINEWVSIDETSSILSCLAGVLDKYGYTSTGIDANYISEINGIWAGELDYMSGWMCMLNDWFINEGMEAFTVESGKLSAGDEIRIFFSLNGGEDYSGTWSNNDKTVKELTFDKGTLAPEFVSTTKEYTLTLPTGTDSIVVTPTATNRNFQVRTSVDGTEYKRTESVPVENGTVITVKCGDPEWPTMNNGEMGSGAEAVPAEEYTVMVVYEDNNTAPTLKGAADAKAKVEPGATYSLDLSTVFEDVDGDELFYTVSVNEEEAVETKAEFSYTPTETGTYVFSFKANDGKAESPEYRVTLSVEVEFKGTEVVVNNNVIDITDSKFASLASYHATVTGLKIAGADVVSATEDGTDIYILLSEETAADAVLNVEFQCSTNRFTVEPSASECVLADGQGNLTVKLSGKYNGRTERGTRTYQLYFKRDVPVTEPPARLTVEDAKEIYAGDKIVINVKKYFDKASVYYLVNGEELEQLEGNNYTFSTTSNQTGKYTFVFAASNKIGMCEDYVTVVINVKTIEGGIYINHITDKGSLNYVIFTDGEGNQIEGLECAMDGTTINVVLPKTYDINGTIKSRYSLTQNADGLPFVTTKTGASGTSSDRAVNNIFTEKNHTLSSGAASFAFYFYNVVPSATNNPYTTYRINFAVKNEIPVLVKGQEATEAATITAGESYQLDLSKLFTDADGDALTYSVSINGETAILAESDYSFTSNIAGTYNLVFTANDGKGTSTDTYTVTLTVENSTVTETMTVNMQEGLNPVFYATNGYEGGVDVLGDVLTVEETTTDGVTTYTVVYPENVENLSVRTENWGGVSFTAEKGSTVTLSKVQFETKGFGGVILEAASSVKYSDYSAVAGAEGYLLVAGTEYSCTVTPTDTDYAAVTTTVVPEAEKELQIVTVSTQLKNPKTITVPTGATAQLFAYNKYYDYSELTAKAMVDNEDGTTTYYYATSNNQLTYRASMDGKVTEAGYWSKNVTVDFDNGANSSQNNASVSDNSVLVNVNGQNHLSMEIGETYKLKGYRIWEIIYNSTNNWIITPDFHFNILSGSDVISLEAVDSRSNGGSDEDSDWMNVTALKEGTAVIEVTYDAIDVAGGGWSGLYGASDSDRTALIIVTVGGADNSVKFGIDGYSSMGSLVYQEANKKDWDAEFDTLYFTGESGKLNFAPTASNEITEVAVSNNKGNDWTVLAAEEGSYTADITSGNNIIRVTTTAGTAYQIVRGAKVNVSVAEVDGAGNGNGLVDAGETVRVTFEGLYTPIPKMAGNYNPGYKANTQGDSSVHMVYTFNGEAVNGAGAQYTFATEANYIDVTIPEDYTEKTIDLSEGYIAVGVIGLTNFATGGDSHRNIPDGGCTTRGSQTTFNTRSILPDITLTIGEETAPNNAPMVAPDAVTEGSIELGQNYALNPETLFTDKDGDILTYYVSVNGSEAEEVTAAYKFTPNEAGTYELVFTAKDKEAEASHTVTLTVMPVEEPEPELDFNISEDEILGYTTISFEDYGVREEGATGLKYPEPLGMIIEATKVPYKADDTIADVTLRLLDALGIGYEYTGTTKSGFYLAAISDFVVDNTPYDYMGEFDAGSGSGWMITLNDVFINKGTSDFKAADGDVIRWQYTCQLGADIGDDYYQKAVKEVEGLIDAIGTVTLDSGEAISAARTAYDKLEDRQKETVTNYNVLIEAEEIFAQLKAEEPDVQVIAFGWSGDTKWTLTDDGILTFIGAGVMKRYTSSTAMPWNEYKKSVKEVIIEEGITRIGDFAFYGMTNLESVQLPAAGLTEIGKYAFKGCEKLEEIQLNTGLKTIGEAAFYGCSALKAIYIPDGVYTIWEYTFKNCTSLNNIRLPKTLIKIDQGAFESCTGLNYIFIPGETDIIGAWSFKGCTGLKEADMFYADAIEIREGAFKNCKKLQTIAMPKNLEVIGESAFYGIGAADVVVPETVKLVKAWSFARAGLKSITFTGNAPKFEEGVFNKIEVTAYYPADNATWTADVMRNYDGTVTWEAK